eukprot:3790209-Lingulodinium_polyedra.AAC.1
MPRKVHPGGVPVAVAPSAAGAKPRVRRKRAWGPRQQRTRPTGLSGRGTRKNAPATTGYAKTSWQD